MQNAQEANFYLEVLKSLVSQPTAPFHEERVCHKIIAFLNKIGVPFEIDRWGNVIAHYHKGNAPRALALMAHTDHPALELIEANAPSEVVGANWTARLMGGVAAQCFEQPSNVRLYQPGSDEAISGQLIGYKSGSGGPRDILLFLKIAEAKGLKPGDFGVWDLPDFELNDGFIHARVIDDLVGCAAILLVLQKLVQEQIYSDVYGVFTRAEEVGLVGAEMLLQNKSLPLDCFVVSLEASKALPGAVQGEGPVIRVGDRGFTFSETAEFMLKQAADKMGSDVVRARLPQIKIQRQLMSGGRCEGSAAIMHGYAATGLAFPLGNYHNVAADFTLQMENIHEQDFITGVELLFQTAQLMPDYNALVAAQRTAENSNSRLVERLLETAENIHPAQTSH